MRGVGAHSVLRKFGDPFHFIFAAAISGSSALQPPAARPESGGGARLWDGIVQGVDVLEDSNV